MQSCHRKVNLLRTLELCIQNKQPYVPFDIEELKSIAPLTALNVFPTDTGTTPLGWTFLKFITPTELEYFRNSITPKTGIMVNEQKTGFFIYYKSE